MENERGSEQPDTVIDVAAFEATRAAEILDGIRSKDQERAVSLVSGDVSDINEKERTVKLSFASEYPVFRRDLNAMEVIEMSESAANLRRLNSCGALLNEHKRDDQIGAVVKAWIGADKRAYATVKFSQSARGQEFFQDVVDGIRRNVSFHYRIYDGKVKAGKRGSNEPDTFIATSWEATEISLVSVPADPTIGVGRSADVVEPETSTTESETTEAQRSEDETPIEPAAVSAPAITTTQRSERGSHMEREQQILEFGKLFGAEELARSFALDPNKSLDDFRKALADKEAAKQRREEVTTQPQEKQPTHLDLSRKEAEKYSLMRAVKAIVAGKRDGFEFECHTEIARRLNRETVAANAILVPVDIQTRSFGGRRDLSVGLGSQPGDGGALVGTDHLAGSFIDVLRNNMLMAKLGVRIMSGLVGDVQIPRQDGTGSTYWVTEGVAPTESQPSFGQTTLSPKTVGAVTEFTRLLMLQSAPSVEQLVWNDLGANMGRAVDLAIINGSGASGQPTGILNTTGVDAITLSGAGSTFIYADAVEMETAIQEDNAPEGFAYVTRPGHRGTLKTRVKVEGSTFPVFLCDDNNRMNGYPVRVTTQMPSGKLIFGDYTQVIVGEWGILEIQANPYSTGFRAGNVEIRALQSCDIAVRYPESLKKVTSFL